ncbi:glutaredoxin domain-containing protein [Leuconostoc falkenbergense]|uniref:glutaredoxin domain-containing protein n=1 Tax=Leuconostoc falkenbergense TaxID=2766470 RepID=UPI0039E88C90
MTVYVKNNCPQCHATIKWLTDHHIKFDAINISEPINSGKLTWLKALGVRQTPYVDTGNKQWSGFRPDLLNELVK